jgi:predicted ATPase
LGKTAFVHGDFVAARAHLEQCLPLDDTCGSPPSTFPAGYEPAVMHRSFFAQVLWELGYADQVQQRSQEALALARSLGHPPSLVYAQFFATILAQCRRDVPATQAGADALMALAAEQGFARRLELARILRGWALAMRGDAAAGVAQIRQGLTVSQGGPLPLYRPYFLMLLAEAYSRAGQPEAGLAVLAEAVTLMSATEARWWEAEVSRLKGELLGQLPSPDVHQVEACFQQALDVARQQWAKALELRAAVSLSRWWQQQGKRDDARELLAPIYDWFTEGFDTIDLQEAEVLLEELS